LEFEPIGGHEFERRLEALLLRGGRLHGFPRRRRDRLILLRSVLAGFEPGRRYEEEEVNQAIRLWQREVGRNADIDHVSLRRGLIDERLLTRSRSGDSYEVPNLQADLRFDASVDAVDLRRFFRPGSTFLVNGAPRAPRVDAPETLFSRAHQQERLTAAQELGIWGPWLLLGSLLGGWVYARIDVASGPKAYWTGVGLFAVIMFVPCILSTGTDPVGVFGRRTVPAMMAAMIGFIAAVLFVVWNAHTYQ